MVVERHLPTVGIAQMLENGLLEVGLFLLGSRHGLLELLRDSFFHGRLSHNRRGRPNNCGESNQEYVNVSFHIFKTGTVGRLS